MSFKRNNPDFPLAVLISRSNDIIRRQNEIINLQKRHNKSLKRDIVSFQFPIYFFVLISELFFVLISHKENTPIQIY